MVELMALGKVTILLKDFGPFELDDCTICGRFAVHEALRWPDKEHWVITHIKSGIQVSGFYKTLTEAKQAAEKLDSVGSSLWNFKAQPTDADVMAKLRREAEFAGLKFGGDDFEHRVASLNNSVNRARAIEKRFATRRND